MFERRHVLIELGPQALTSVCKGCSSASRANHGVWPSVASPAKCSIRILFTTFPAQHTPRLAIMSPKLNNSSFPLSRKEAPHAPDIAALRPDEARSGCRGRHRRYFHRAFVSGGRKGPCGLRGTSLLQQPAPDRLGHAELPRLLRPIRAGHGRPGGRRTHPSFALRKTG